jgi:hypothetical protein
MLLVLAIGLAWFLSLRGLAAWKAHWLLEDGQTGVAQVTSNSNSGHAIVEYEYSVGQNSYRGSSQRNSRIEAYRNVPIGGKSVVYYSASHPGLSSLDMPASVITGLPAVLVALSIEILALFTLLKPNSTWALSKGKDGSY